MDNFQRRCGWGKCLNPNLRIFLQFAGTESQGSEQRSQQPEVIRGPRLHGQTRPFEHVDLLRAGRSLLSSDKSESRLLALELCGTFFQERRRAFLLVFGSAADGE